MFVNNVPFQFLWPHISIIAIVTKEGFFYFGFVLVKVRIFMLIHYTATIKHVIHLTNSVNLKIKLSNFHQIYVLIFFSNGSNEIRVVISVTVIRVGSET